MEENKNQQGNVTFGSQKPDYYISTGRKVTDFLMGFFGAILLSVVYTTFISTFAYSLFSSATSAWANLIISIVVMVLLSVLFFKIGRRFIAVGIIAISLLPILIFGSCLLLFGQGF